MKHERMRDARTAAEIDTGPQTLRLINLTVILFDVKSSYSQAT